MRRWIPTFDAVVAFGCRDALAGVAEFDVALQVEPAGGRIGIAFHHHRTVAVSGKVKMDIAVHILFSMFSKRMIALVEQLITPSLASGSRRQTLKPAAATNVRAERAKKVRGASFIAASRSSKSSYRNS